jgi:hypothetical protein
LAYLFNKVQPIIQMPGEWTIIDMSQSNSIVNNYWLNRAKVFIEETLAQSPGHGYELRDTIKEELTELYNQLNATNGQIIFDKANQLLSQYYYIRTSEHKKGLMSFGLIIFVAGMIVLGVAKAGKSCTSWNRFFRCVGYVGFSVGALGLFVGALGFLIH